jgi:hypothetical protein
MEVVRRLYHICMDHRDEAAETVQLISYHLVERMTGIVLENSVLLMCRLLQLQQPYFDPVRLCLWYYYYVLISVLLPRYLIHWPQQETYHAVSYAEDPFAPSSTLAFFWTSVKFISYVNSTHF